MSENKPLEKVPLLLLPGLLCDARLWRDQAAALGAVARIHNADLTLDEDVDAMARRAVAAMPGRFALAGLSMGGYVAFAVLRAVPERVTRLCIFDSSARPDSEAQSRRRRGLIALTRTGRFRGVTPRLLPQLIHADRLGDAALASTVMDMAERVGKEAFIRQQRAILARPDSRPLLPGLHMPVTVAVGEGDQLTPPDHAREIATLVPGAEFTVLAGCGHLPTLEDPAAATEIMRNWLARPAQASR